MTDVQCASVLALLLMAIGPSSAANQEAPPPASQAPAEDAPAAPPASAPPTPIVIEPRWARGALFEFPDRAIARRISEGRGVVDCTLTTEGRLAACNIVSEEPAGVGFGMAALGGAIRSGLIPPDGFVPGQRIRFSVRFILPDEE